MDQLLVRALFGTDTSRAEQGKKGKKKRHGGWRESSYAARFSRFVLSLSCGAIYPLACLSGLACVRAHGWIVALPSYKSLPFFAFRISSWWLVL
jgi:hypothetical protein